MKKVCDSPLVGGVDSNKETTKNRHPDESLRPAPQ